MIKRIPVATQVAQFKAACLAALFAEVSEAQQAQFLRLYGGLTAALEHNYEHSVAILERTLRQNDQDGTTLQIKRSRGIKSLEADIIDNRNLENPELEPDGHLRNPV